jgi:hypothetical protein
MRPAAVLLLTYTFDHLPDPLAFLHAVRGVLDPERGVLLIEVHDLAKIIERRETCLFEHEHSIYLSARTMQKLLASAGFRLLATGLVGESERRGNSLLIAAAMEGSSRCGTAEILGEDLCRLDNWTTYQVFGDVVRQSNARLLHYVSNRIESGARLAGYGAGGRGVITLAMAGLTSKEIAYVCDQNGSFHGLYAPRSHVQVVPPSRIREDPVDELIVFSYGYLDEIRAELREFTEGGGHITSILDIL